MKWLRDLLAWGSHSPDLTPPQSSPVESLLGPLELSAFSELERKLDILTRSNPRPAGMATDDTQAWAGKRVEAEVQRYFGSEALQGIQSTANALGHGTIAFTADRLLVTFLGRSAAMAVTRKLYSNTK